MIESIQPVSIVPYSGQYVEVAQIFDRAVHEVASEFYSEAQCSAWAPRPVDFDRWKKRCEQKQPFLALVDEKIAGFIEFDPDGHIDCHYVSPKYHRCGVGGQLLDHVIELAKARSDERLFVEASHVAKGLYLKRGFQVVRSQQVERQGIMLQNWVMELPLSAAPNH